MRKVKRILLWLLGVLVLIPVLAITAALVLLNIDPGRRLVERLAQQLTAGQVVIAGLGGRFPDALTLRHAELHDDCDYSPYEGHEVRGMPVFTLSRGECVWDRGEVVAAPGRGRPVERCRGM